MAVEHDERASIGGINHKLNPDKTLIAIGAHNSPAVGVGPPNIDAVRSQRARNSTAKLPMAISRPACA